MWSELERKEAAVFIDHRSTVFIEEQFSLEMLVPFHFWLVCRWESIFEILDKALVWKLEWDLQWTEVEGEEVTYGSMTVFIKKSIKKNISKLNFRRHCRKPQKERFNWNWKSTTEVLDWRKKKTQKFLGTYCKTHLLSTTVHEKCLNYSTDF